MELLASSKVHRNTGTVKSRISLTVSNYSKGVKHIVVPPPSLVFLLILQLIPKQTGTRFPSMKSKKRGGMPRTMQKYRASKTLAEQGEPQVHVNGDNV